jgi:integrase
VRIHLRKKTVKATKQGRFDRNTFVTPEVADMIRQYVKEKKRGPTDQVFTKCYTSERGRRFRDELVKQLKRLGLDQKLEGHKFHVIHPHCFRKFFARNADSGMGPTAAHAMMGHGDYLKTYTKKPLHEMQDDDFQYGRASTRDCHVRLGALGLFCIGRTFLSFSGRSRP